MLREKAHFPREFYPTGYQAQYFNKGIQRFGIFATKSEHNGSESFV